jgi:acetylornithine deacetylase
MGRPPCVRYLQDYVAIPSVNPMGSELGADERFGERRYAEHLREQLRRLGLDAELVGDAERPSVVAEARAAGATETLIVASHLDTVPVEGMEIDPFDPRIEGTRLYGRGSCDTKGGMAALVEALEHVLSGGSLRRNLVVVGEADEEFGSSGAHAVVERLRAHAGDRVRWALATEPTELRLVSCHKGIAHARLVARGLACHSSNPGAGRSAIVSLARAVLALEEHAVELAACPDPRLGPATLSIGQIEGGSAPNVVPDRASLVLDRRLLPWEDEASARAGIQGALEKAGLGDVQIERCELMKWALSTPDASPAVQACRRALVAAGLPDAPDVAAFGTDAGVFARSGVAAVVLGPGSVAQAHTSREWVDLRQVEAMARILRQLLES